MLSKIPWVEGYGLQMLWKNPSFVTGHDFSRAAKNPIIDLGFSP